MLVLAIDLAYDGFTIYPIIANNLQRAENVERSKNELYLRHLQLLNIGDVLVQHPLGN